MADMAKKVPHLVKKGHSYYQREQSAEDRATYAAAEEEARRLRLDLWQDAQPMPPWEPRREDRQGTQVKK